jgi:hypothetical protein
MSGYIEEGKEFVIMVKKRKEKKVSVPVVCYGDLLVAQLDKAVIDTLQMDTAIETIIDNYFHSEEQNFQDWLNEKCFANKEDYLDHVKTHIFYSLYLLKYMGNIEKVNEKLLYYIDEKDFQDYCKNC